jgi:hypothetical protein
VSDPQIPPKATSPWFLVVLIVTAGVVPLCLLVSRSALPPGADPGHLLGLSYALEGHGPEGPLKYPPALPFAMLLLRRFSGAETELLYGFVKAMGILLLLFEALGLGAYAGATAGGRAGAWTFMLGALNPNSWNQLLWGGYAQFGAIGAGASALAFLHKGLAAPRHEGTGYRIAAAFLLGCVPLFHLYSVPFFLGASICLCLLHVRGSSAGVVVSRAVTVALLSGIVFIPAIPAYANIAGAIDRSPWDPQLHLQSYQIAIAEVAQGIYFHPAVNGLMFVAFVLTIAAGRWRRCLFPWLLPFLVGSLLLFVLTPPLHAARAGTFLCHAVVLLMGMSLGQRGERNLPWPLLLVLILTPLIDYRDLEAQHSNYAPLGLVETKAMRDLGRTAEGRVWVVSPSPNIDGWWFQGLTGRSALIGDRLRWYMYSDERIRSVDAQTMLHSSQVLDGGSLRLLRDVETTSLWVHDREEYYPLLQIRCASSQEARSVVWETEGNALGFTLRCRADTDLLVRIEPFPGVRALRVTGRDRSMTLDLEFLYQPFRFRGMTRSVELDVKPLASEEIDIEREDDHVLVRALSEPPPGVELHGRVSGLTPTLWRSWSRGDLMDRWGVTHVLVRDQPAGASSFEDERTFQFLWKLGRLSAYRIRRD